MFETIEQAPPDAILGLNEAFQTDDREGKINLTAGVYKDETGATPILDCVKRGEQQLMADEGTKSYLGIDGLKSYRDYVPQLLFGEGHEIIESNRFATLQTPGGTGALRVAADLINAKLPQASIWVSKPTWANHNSVFSRAGLEVKSYAYLHSNGTSMDADAFLESLAQIPAGDAVCLHACCHNPTGVDPTPEQWEQVAKIVSERDLLPLIDCAYQGFGVGLEEDVQSIRILAQTGREMLICSSYSKNFGLYGERVGAMTLVAGDAEVAKRVLSQAKACIRANYSNPPKHGAAIVAQVLSSPELRKQWEEELAEMRSRIRKMRERFVELLASKAPDHDFSHIAKQNGMFSFSGLTPVQVDQLRNDFGIYIVGSGRINVAGITSANIEKLTSSIAAVL